MHNLWEIYENLNEYVYVIDMDSYDLVYVNRKLRNAVGLSEEDYHCKKCYQTLQNNTEPCAICNTKALQPGQFKEWQYYNPLLNRHLLIKNTMLESDNRRYRMEIAIDVSQLERRGEKFRSKENLEMHVHAGLKLAMQATSSHQSINIVLEYLGKALKGERTYVFEKNETGGDDNTYEWVADGVTAEKDNLQNLPPEICAHWYAAFGVDKTITIENLEDIREEDPLQYENLKKQGIRSLVVVPLYDDGKAIGFYGIDNPPSNSLEYASSMLQIMGYFIVSFIRRRKLVNRLENISLHDQLTCLGNRYAMEKYIDEINPQEKLGIVYCDITGLKHVNDTQGHKAGDRLIVRACECLERIFGEYGLFRIGGDELLVLCQGIEEKELVDRVRRLREDTAEHDVILAIGAVWETQGVQDIDHIFSKAEAKMYEDKAAYYKQSGIERRMN